MAAHIEEIKKYIFSKESVTIPELQKQFSMNYSEAWQCVQTLTGENSLVYDGGISYKVIPPVPQYVAPEASSAGVLASEALFRAPEPHADVRQEEIDRNAQGIIDTLADYSIDVTFRKAIVGPAFTRYDFGLPEGPSMGSILRRDAEIAMRLRIGGSVRTYENRACGGFSVEVPNAMRNSVSLLSVVQSREFRKSGEGALTFAIGQNVEGDFVCGNLSGLAHVLVVGTAGSGKTTFLHTMLASLIQRYSHEEMKLLLIDPKACAFQDYAGVPHLVAGKIVTEAERAVVALGWAISEMERRYTLFAEKTRSGAYVRDIDDYNESLAEGERKLPKIVIVIDDFSDLMMVAKRGVEDRLMRIVQKSRAAGIHVVVATQRTDPCILDHTIKSNFPTRIAHRVVQEIDSRVVLEEPGAEKLLGFGDLLMKTPGERTLSRIQGAYVSRSEIQSVVEHAKQAFTCVPDDGVVGDSSEDSAADSDAKCIQALRLVVKCGSASISLLQRKCEIGYNHAGKILEWMEAMGYVAPFDGRARARKVLLTKEEFEKHYGSLD